MMRAIRELSDLSPLDFMAQALVFALIANVCVATGAVADALTLDTPASISVTTTCEAMAAAYCQGAFGFRISGGGEWETGPAPDGHTSAGQLTQLEATKIQAAALELLEGYNREPINCKAQPQFPPGVLETVVVAVPQLEITLFGAGGRLSPSCGGAGSAPSTLFQMVDQLMRRYYPRPM
jgi:hypothetical protein